MKNIFLASVAFVVMSTSGSFAAVSVENPDLVGVQAQHDALPMFADKGGDGGNSGQGGGNSGGGGGSSGHGGGNSGGGGGGSDDGADHDSGDDHGGANSNDDDDHDDADDSDDRAQDNGGGRRPRVPGGSGCDSAEDRAEHAECAG